MRKFIIHILIVFFFVFGTMGIVNYLIDPSNVYHSEAVPDKVIEGVHQGLNVTGNFNMNERIYKCKFANIHARDEVDYIAFGNSRIMTLSSDIFIDRKFLNMGMSSSKLEDMIAIYQACKDNSITFTHAIISVDPVLFNLDDNDTQWISIAEYFHEFMGEGGGIFEIDKWFNLVSPTYFKSSVKSAVKIALYGSSETNIQYVNTVINNNYTRRYDGSIYYDERYREKNQTDIDYEAKTEGTGAYIYCHLDSSRLKLFIRFIETLKKDGIEPIFYCCPFHPILYSRIYQGAGTLSAMNFVKHYAAENHIKTIGTFNPDSSGFYNTDFYNGFHARKESLDKLVRKGLNLYP